MQIIARHPLRLFWEKHPRAEGPLRTWHAIVLKAGWKGPADVKRTFGANVVFDSPTAALIGDGAGNLYGTTPYRGTTRKCSCGTVFEVTPDGLETIRYAFQSKSHRNGSTPEGRLIIDSGGPRAGLFLSDTGTLYRTTFTGGNFGVRTGFALSGAVPKHLDRLRRPVKG